MKRADRIKLDFTRNWSLPGRERLTNIFKPSAELKNDMFNGITWLADEEIAIYTTADNYIEWSILCGGTYEHEINKLIKISLKEGDAALDIGANIGLQSMRMSKAVGAGHVYAFEPLIHLQQKLAKNKELNRADNITLLPFALSDEEREAEFSISKDAWNQGTFSIANRSEGKETQTVQIKIGDDLPEINRLTRLDLVKIDVEGFEFPVMRGLKHTLQRFRPRIIFEYDQNYWNATGQLLSECISFLDEIGYDKYLINAAGCELITSDLSIAGGNLFCIPAQQ